MNKIDDNLRHEANLARQASLILAENIYKYIGGLISIDDLQNIVDNLLSKEYITRFKHQYILKDTYSSLLPNIFSDDIMISNIEEDDTDTFELIEEGDEIDRSEKTP